LLKAVAHHTDVRWVLLYIERWLKAPMQMPDGTLLAREKGTPQGSPISPLLANFFMQYAFDRWMTREYPGCPFERYADDIVAHCDSEEQARELRAAIAERLGALGLELHPDKTKIVFCKDSNRRGEAEHTSFDFLGYTFRGRLARGPRGYFVSFSPAMSTKAKKAVGLKIRAWYLIRRSGTDLSGLAPNPWGASQLSGVLDSVASHRPDPAAEHRRDLVLAFGDSAGDIGIGGDDWTVRVGEPSRAAASCFGVGLQAAAAFGASEALKAALAPIGIVAVRARFEWDLLTYTYGRTDPPDGTGLVGEVIFAGAGSVNSSAAAVLMPAPPGRAIVVDPDTFDVTKKD